MRLVIVFLVFVSIFFVVSIGLLFPSYISLQTEKATYKDESAALAKQIEIKDKKGLTATMSQIQSDLSLVKPEETQIYRAINAILNQVTSDISIVSIGYTRGDNALSSLNIQGVAKERTSLLTFSNNLKKELLFSSVDLPVSNLAKQTDAKFNLTLLGKF